MLLYILLGLVAIIAKVLAVAGLTRWMRSVPHGQRRLIDGDPVLISG